MGTVCAFLQLVFGAAWRQFGVREALRRGVSTRNYGQVLPEMAETVGIAKSSVSREFQEASEKALKELTERRFEDKDILILYLDGLILGGHHMVAALGVDPEGSSTYWAWPRAPVRTPRR